ncbi:hypothetical protein Tco_0159494, partial [Tanacetum coccineum]
LFHLEGDIIIDLEVALRMSTRRIIIKKRVKDVQLGVESYQKKLNITKPQKDFPTISAKESYPTSFDLQRVVYEDLSKHKRLIHTRRKWSDMDKRRSGIMVKLIDEKLLEKRIMQNLERMVGAREIETEYRLM